MKDELERLRDLKGSLSEHFIEYLIIVRTKSATASIASDKAWSVGAADLYLTNIRNQQLIDSIDDKIEKDQEDE